MVGIKNMEMPENCRKCLFRAFTTCTITGCKIEKMDKKNDVCPLFSTEEETCHLIDGVTDCCGVDMLDQLIEDEEVNYCPKCGKRVVEE